MAENRRMGGCPYAKPGKGKEQIDSQLLKAFVEANDYLIAPSKSRSRYWHNIVTRIGYNTRGNCYDHLRGGMADLTDHSGFYDLHPAFQPLGRGVIIGQPYDTGNGPLREYTPCRVRRSAHAAYPTADVGGRFGVYRLRPGSILVFPRPYPPGNHRRKSRCRTVDCPTPAAGITPRPTDEMPAAVGRTGTKRKPRIVKMTGSPARECWRRI